MQKSVAVLCFTIFHNASTTHFHVLQRFNQNTAHNVREASSENCTGSSSKVVLKQTVLAMDSPVLNGCFWPLLNYQSVFSNKAYLKITVYGAKICCLRCGQSLSNCMLASKTRGIYVEYKCSLQSYEFSLTQRFILRVIRKKKTPGSVFGENKCYTIY